MSSSWEAVDIDGHKMDIYLSLPDGAGPFPAVVVSQHAGGVDQFMTSMADRLAKEGYAAVAPNLFHRFADDIPAERSKRSALMSDSQIIADINGTMEFLAQHVAVDNDRIGITGFCMGGRIAWLAAATNPQIHAVVPFYGGNLMVSWGGSQQTPFELADNINCPIMFHFGETDDNPSQEDLRTLDDELTRLGKPHQFYTYPGAGHAFMDFTNPRYHKDSFEVSWPRTLNFFDKYLKDAN